MGLREFRAAKCRVSPAIIYALHGDGHGRLLAVDRSYRPVGHKGFADYGDSQFDHLRYDDSPEIRAQAASVNEDGRSNFPCGTRVPILVLLAHDDSRDTYCRRLQALLKVARG